MITFTAGKTKLQVQYASMTTDLQSYYAVVELVTPMYVPPRTEVLMEGDSTQKLVTLSTVYQETSYKVTCVSDKQFEMLKLVTPPFQGDATVKNLLSNLGATAVIEEDSASTWWMLPSLNYSKLLWNLNRLTEMPNGGAPRFHLDLEGNIRLVNLKGSYESTSTSDILGIVSSDYNDLEWTLRVPGNLRMLCSDVESMEVEDVKLNEELSWAKVIVSDNTTYQKEIIKRAFVNDYNYNWYSSRKIVLNEILSAPHHVGQCVLINGLCKGVISSLTIPIRLNTESVRLSARIVCPPLSEQK